MKVVLKSFPTNLDALVALRADQWWRENSNSFVATSSCRLLQVSEAVSAHHVERSKDQSTNHATAANEQSEAMGVKPWNGRSQNVLGEPSTEKSTSSLHALALAVVDSAHKIVVGFRKELLMQAVHRVPTSGTYDPQAIKSLVTETAHLVNEVRVMIDTVHDTSNPEGARHGVGHGSGGQEETRPIARVMVAEFLSSLSLFYGALPDCHHGGWNSLRNCSTIIRMLDSTLEDLVHLAAIAWERSDFLDSGFGKGDAIDVDLGGHSHRTTTRAQDSGNCVCPWDPVIQVVSWGVIPILAAENSLLSCIQNAANLEPGAEALGFRERTDSWKKDCLFAVVAAVAKGYHSLGVGQDLSTVSLFDMLAVAARVSNAAKLSRYHPMDLCRLVGRLTMA